MDLGYRCSTSENPRSDRQNLVRFLEITFRAEQSNIRRGQAASAFRKWNVVIEMQILLRTTLNTLTTVASPDFDLDRRWDQSVVRKIDNTTKRLLLNRFQRKLEHLALPIRNDVRIDQLEETFVAPNSARNLLINFHELRLLAQSAFEIHRRAKEFPVLSPRSFRRR
jgi:hypothetical protein